ncbi:nucleoporin 88 [Stigmatopora nigra]
MAAFGTDRWLDALANHDMFKKVRDKLESEPKTLERAVAKNLIFCMGGDFFLWDDVDRVFYTTSLRQLNTAEDQGDSFQTLLCINPPRFPVCQLLLSPTQGHVALVGQRGVSVLELPQRWGKKSEYEGGRSCVNCKSTPVAERFFTSSPFVSLRQAAWYPSATGEPLLVLLTSDNTLRFYGLKAPHAPLKVVPVSQTDDDTSGGVRAPARSFAASLGEVAVAFDFGPASFVRERPVYPLYILYETGETYLCHVSQVNTLRVGKLMGPLPMYPGAEDNYGYDACAVLCLPCVPPILVIATATGTLYHCVVMESDEDDEEDVAEPRCLTGSLPALYVFECVELELTLKVAAAGDEAEDEPDSACPLRLHRDPLCPQRYHCTHEAGVHSVGLPWAHKLATFLRAGEDERDGLPEAPAERRCAVEHIVCTRPLVSSKPAPVCGFLVLSDLSLGATMICVSAAYECILLPLLCSVRAPSPPLLCGRSDPGSSASPLRGLAGSSFEQHVRNILARGATNPLLLKAGDGEPSPQERLQLLSRATQVFREEYILKQDMAREELQKRVKLLRGQRAKQLEELGRCREERATLRREAERLADKYEDVKYRQDAASRRVKRALAAQRLRLPVLSDGEKDMRKELHAVAEQLKHLDVCIKQVKMKMEYQKTQVERQPSAATYAGGVSVSLSGPQKKVVRDVLREEGQQIVDMMKQVKEMSRLVAMKSSDMDSGNK